MMNSDLDYAEFVNSLKEVYRLTIACKMAKIVEDIPFKDVCDDEECLIQQVIGEVLEFKDWIEGNET